MRVVGEDGFGDLVADAHDRVEGGHGLLKDHGDAGAAELAHRVVWESGEIARGGGVFGEENFSGDLGLRREQAHDGERGDGFAGAGFADEAEDFAGGDGEGEIADGGESWRDSRHRLIGRPEGCGLRGECDIQIANFEQWRHEGYGSSRQKRRLRRRDSRGRLSPHAAPMLTANNRFLHYAVAFAPAPVGMTKICICRDIIVETFLVVETFLADECS